MCLIVDANCAANLVNGHAEAIAVSTWLKKRSSKLVVGGTKLAKEYSRLAKFTALLATLSSRGQVQFSPNDQVDARERVLKQSNVLDSDDEHIIALAIVSGSRTLYSHDGELHGDFGSTVVLSPRGRVYQNCAHAHLLQASAC